MTTRYQKAFSAIALFLIFSISHVYVQASLLASNAASESRAATALVPSGKLATRSGNLIRLNGNDVVSGTTILSGARIQTPAEGGATVQLGQLGKVELAPSTDLTLTFGQSNVDVKLGSGYVALTTLKGIDGSMVTPNGAVTKNDPSTVSTLVGKTDENAAAPAQGNSGNQGGGAGGNGGGTGLFGLSNAAARTFGLTVLGIAIAIAVIEAHHHGRGINPSPAAFR